MNILGSYMFPQNLQVGKVSFISLVLKNVVGMAATGPTKTFGFKLSLLIISRLGLIHSNREM